MPQCKNMWRTGAIARGFLQAPEHAAEFNCRAGGHPIGFVALQQGCREGLARRAAQY
jgi:hypothetical protein